ncbi:MAG: ATP-binding cassette domain-containing protein [Casimicrobiaceae bacterium]
MNTTATPLLAVRDLVKVYPYRRGRVRRGQPSEFRAVDGVSFDVAPGQTLGLVGESGSGKSTIGRAVAMLSPPTQGSVRFEGVELTTLGSARLRAMRRRFQVVFQDPYASLNPRMKIGDFVAEPLAIHEVATSREERAARVAECLRDVGLDPSFAGRYPHQFSGGQRQRICIARAVVLKPSFIVADEPLSALDVSIQAQVVNLMLDLQERLSLTYLFISHDLSMVRFLCHRVAVLYGGRIVELAPTEELFQNPLHPYTRTLLSAIPIADPQVERSRRRILMDPSFDYGEPDSALVEVSPGHHLAAARVA